MSKFLITVALLVTFTEVKDVIWDNCIQCHNHPIRFDKYEVAKLWNDEFIKRACPPRPAKGFMPPDYELYPEECQVFIDWKEGGYATD